MTPYLDGSHGQLDTLNKLTPLFYAESMSDGFLFCKNLSLDTF